MTKAVVIDDEEKGISALCQLLEEFCPEVVVTNTARSVAEGLKVLKTASPDIVFLDIAMRDGSGFSILEQIPNKEFEVIFITAHHEFATKAFDFAALHYLLKPINPAELQNAVHRYNKIHRAEKFQYEIFHKVLNNDFGKIALPSKEGITFINLDDIIRCEAAESYTFFFLKDKSKLVVSKSLNKYEKLLGDSFFYRIHDKHLINLRFVKKYIRGKGGSVVLTDGFSADVSIRRKTEFLNMMAEYARTL